MKILVVSGHPHLENSVANKAAIEHLREKYGEDIVVDDLGAKYADFQINIEKEQELLADAEVIIFEYPIYWYGAPALLQRWMEEVLQHGFAYGSTADALKNKKVIASFTTGAPESAYADEMTPELLAAPVKAMAKRCDMVFAGFVYTGGISHAAQSDEAVRNNVISRMKAHAEKIEQLF